MIQSEINSGFESDENKTEKKQDENVNIKEFLSLFLPYKY